MTERTLPGDGAEQLPKAEQIRRLTEQSLEQLAEQLAAGDSRQLSDYLRAMARFHRYSFGNLLLILLQKPEASYVAGFHTWRSMGRSVKRGEKGIAIFAPIMLKARSEESQSKPSDGNDAVDSKAPPIIRFRVVYVFDISQTEGEPMPALSRVGGDPGESLARLEAAVRGEGITVETVEHLGGALGRSRGGTIELVASLSAAERFSILVHEWAHEILHQCTPVEDRPDKTVCETEAESVAFVVNQAIGLETENASADYIRLYQGDKETLAASLDRIQKTACRIIDEVLCDQGAGRRAEPPTTRTPALAAEHHRRRQR